LIIAAQGVQIFMTPILFFWEVTDLHCIMPCTLGNMQIQLIMTYNPCKDVSVNRGDDSGHGSTVNTALHTPYLITTEYFFEDDERAFYENEGIEQHLYVQNCEKHTVNDQSGVTTIQKGMSHPTRAFIWFARQHVAIDGTSYRKLGVGLKDRFDFGTGTGAESVTKARLEASSNTSNWHSIVPAMYHRSVEAQDCFKVCGRELNQPYYIYSFCENPMEFPCRATANMSRFENPLFKFQLNNDPNNDSTDFYFVQLNIKYVFTVAGSLTAPYIG
jgi:hypothetical protein